MLTSTEVINWLKLQPNSFEGGYFSATYESKLRINDKDLPGFAATENGRPLCNAIYYLLTSESCSVMHRVTGDMIYHFYSGDPVQMLLLYPDGGSARSEVCIFSNDIKAGGIPMKTIPGGTWLGSRLTPGSSYALMGVTMAPGFHPNDYSIGIRNDLVNKYPEQKEMITMLTTTEKVNV
jgi:predicted cupin superfamily sugar epimerase